MTTAGLLLAAGAGSRMGMPKALVRDQDGTSWLHRSVTALLDGGCSTVTVVLGADVESARLLLEDGFGDDPSVSHVLASDWADGMGASLRVGLAALAARVDAQAAIVSLVDLPDVGPEVVRRVLAAGDGPDVLARAAYAGRPGHPVLMGRAHWAAAMESAIGDQGARGYLADAQPSLVECGDLATGDDRDHRQPGRE